MVLDTSAITAILRAEPERLTFISALISDPVRLISWVTVLEAALVMEGRFGDGGARDLDEFVSSANIDFIAFDSRQYDLARRAWRKFGKGNHRAALNFGDCCVYALAKMTGEPILCKGRDFALTDIPLAVPGTGQ